MHKQRLRMGLVLVVCAFLQSIVLPFGVSLRKDAAVSKIVYLDVELDIFEMVYKDSIRLSIDSPMKIRCRA